jgi:hypothetical protein
MANIKIRDLTPADFGDNESGNYLATALTGSDDTRRCTFTDVVSGGSGVLANVFRTKGDTTNIYEGSVNIGENLTVTGDVTIGGNLIVSGNISGAIISGKTGIFSESLTISGESVATGAGGGGAGLWLENAPDIYYNAGNVGIGLLAPAQTLHVSGTSNLQYDNSEEGMESEGLILKNANTTDNNYAGIGFRTLDESANEHVSSSAVSRFIHNPTTAAANLEFYTSETGLNSRDDGVMNTPALVINSGVGWNGYALGSAVRGLCIPSPGERPSFEDWQVTGLSLLKIGTYRSCNITNRDGESAISTNLYEDNSPTDTFRTQIGRAYGGARYVQNSGASSSHNFYSERGSLSVVNDEEITLYPTLQIPSGGDYAVGNSGVSHLKLSSADDTTLFQVMGDGAMSGQGPVRLGLTPYIISQCPTSPNIGAMAFSCADSGGANYDNGFWWKSKPLGEYGAGDNIMRLTNSGVLKVGTSSVVQTPGTEHDGAIQFDAFLNSMHTSPPNQGAFVMNCLDLGGANDGNGFHWRATSDLGRQHPYNELMRLDISGNLNVLPAGGSITVNGSKAFLIDHPTKPNHLLRYASIEGPEAGVYVRGQSSDNIIQLPDYWEQLVHADSITVSLTPIGTGAIPRIKEIKDNQVHIFTLNDEEFDCFYTIYGERKDIPKIVVEEEKPPTAPGP